MKVLVAVDPGGIEADVLNITKKMFERHPEAECSVVHVQLMGDTLVDTLSNEVELWAESLDANVEIEIQKPHEISEAPIREEVGQIILEDAKELDVDHLVVGVRKRGPLFRFFHGSAANRILSAEERSFLVTVVPEHTRISSVGA